MIAMASAASVIASFFGRAHITCLYGRPSAPPTPVESTTAEDQKQNNDNKYGFHDFLLSL
jgi:hypothetical protein